MQQSFERIKYITGDKDILQHMDQLPALCPFDEKVINYLDLLSKHLLGNSEAKAYPDIITFAFWCRRASVVSLKKPYTDITERLGKGVAFHIAPSNVPVNFAYTLVAGMLAGNANIVRLPSKSFEQVKIIAEAMNKTLDPFLRQYICLIQYDHDQEITDYLSYLCDSRIIWGGDETIAAIRRSPLKARSNEVTFADRFSICVIDSDGYMIEINKKNIALGFYNDTYLSDQNACTSPRIIIWLGGQVQEAQDIFWDELYNIVREKYNLQPVQAVSKYANMCRQAASIPSTRQIATKDNYIIRVAVGDLTGELPDYKGNSGYFIEYIAKELDEILPVCTKQCQTLSYSGIQPEKIRGFMTKQRPKGIDRYVPIGKTMDFTLVWDGYDLIRSLSREISGK